MRGVQHFNVTLSCKVNDSGHFGTWKKNRWNELMKHCVCSGRTCTVSHVHPADDHQLIQQRDITFSDSNSSLLIPWVHIFQALPVGGVAFFSKWLVHEYVEKSDFFPPRKLEIHQEYRTHLYRIINNTAVELDPWQFWGVWKFLKCQRYALTSPSEKLVERFTAAWPFDADNRLMIALCTVHSFGFPCVITLIFNAGVCSIFAQLNGLHFSIRSPSTFTDVSFHVKS